MSKYTIVETFVGCGGAHLGFKKNGFESLLVNDIDKNMINTLLLNKCVASDKCIVAPIEDITNQMLKERINKPVDVLFGGVVCKGFSLAGVRNPFDSRNYLYLQQLRFVKQLNPKVSIIENVTGFKNMYLYRKNKETETVFKKYSELSNTNKNLNGTKSSRRKNNEPYKDLNEAILKNKKNMANIIDSISKYRYNIYDDLVAIYKELGYTVYNKVLVAGEYDGFTTRKRFIIVAVRNDLNKKYEYPKPTKINNLGEALKLIDYENINNPEKDKDNVPMSHNKKTVKRFTYIPEGKNIGDIMDTIPKELQISKFYSRGNTQRLSRNKPSPTLVPGHSNFPIHPTEHRSITVREAATITGFPLDYKFVGSHTSRCMQVGNAVPVYLSDAIAKSVKKILD